MIRIPRQSWLHATLILLGAVSLGAAAESPDKFFEMQIRPLLAENCFKCHGVKKQKGNMRLDTHEGLLKGGDHGSPVVPGNPGKSRMIEAINYGNKELQMPPDGKLSADQIALLTRWVQMGAPWPAGMVINAPAEKKTEITDSDRQFWSFRPLANVQPPAVKDSKWVKTPIDAFILAKLEASGISPAPAADRRTLIRRLYLDLIGLPPEPREVEAFVEDNSPAALEKVVDHLLASPHYGERWAQHWLDLVRYSDSDGYKEDAYRPKSWRYRDWVINAFNSDKPYDRFVQEQLAGDEIDPTNPEALTATGYLRLWPYEYNNRDARLQWTGILDDVTENAGDVFIGLSMGCARCHDHKYDPIPQADYYRLRAFFAPILPDESIVAATPKQIADYQAALKAWEQKAAPVLKIIEKHEGPTLKKAALKSANMFPPDVRDVLLEPDPAKLSPLDQQIRDLANRQVIEAMEKTKFKLEVKTKLDPKASPAEQAKQQAKIDAEQAAKDEYEGAKKALEELEKQKPQPPTPILGVRDVGPAAPPITIPDDHSKRIIEPGYLSVLDPAPAKIESPSTGVQSTGRRTTLAKWLTRPDNPLTTRVIVNRIWHYHFGRGISGTPNDLGKVGDRPSHPELLDWLARQFVAGGWSFKKLHKMIVMSSVYQQSAIAPASKAAMEVDPQNHLLWRMRLRRLDSEQIRDVMLTASGELEHQVGGVGVTKDAPRRSIYLKVMRNSRDPIRDAFDAPDGFVSAAVRNNTTTAPQSLLMINSQWTYKRAAKLAERATQEAAGKPEAAIDSAYRLVLSRPATAAEVDRGRQFLHQQSDRISQGDAKAPADAAFIDFCHSLMNTNQMLYID